MSRNTTFIFISRLIYMKPLNKRNSVDGIILCEQTKTYLNREGTAQFHNTGLRRFCGNDNNR
jgi:hypothetical protein